MYDSDESVEIVGSAGPTLKTGFQVGVEAPTRARDGGNAENGHVDEVGARPKRRAGRPRRYDSDCDTGHRVPKAAEIQRRRTRSPAPTPAPRVQETTSPGTGMNAVRVQDALRACLQDDGDVSDVGSDEDEELRRIKEIQERKRQRYAAGTSFINPDAAVSERGDDVEVVEMMGVSSPGSLGAGGGMISIRFVDARRHEFVTDAVLVNSFDYPVSKFIEHAVGAGWIGGKQDVDRFVFDDEVVEVGVDTPHGLGLEDGDTVDVHYVS